VVRLVSFLFSSTANEMTSHTDIPIVQEAFAALNVADAPIVEATLLDDEMIGDLLDYIRENRHKLTKALLINEINSLGIKKQLSDVTAETNKNFQVSTQATQDASTMMLTSPSQRSNINKIDFTNSGLQLIELFLPNEPSPADLVVSLRLTPPKQRIAWARVLHATVLWSNEKLKQQQTLVNNLNTTITYSDMHNNLAEDLSTLNENINVLDQVLNDYKLDNED
jgi:hypothetical protein